MREATIHVLEPTADEAREALGRLFPDARDYVLKGPTGRRLALTFHGKAACAADPLPLWEALFPLVGPYEIADEADAFLKAVQVQPTQRFEEWFLERLSEEARTQFDSVRTLVSRVVRDFLDTHAGTLVSPAELERFERVLFDLRQGIRWSLAQPVSPAVATSLRQLGFSDRELLDVPGIAYRLGLIDDELRRPGARFSWTRALELAHEVPLSDVDEAAIAIARTQAARYLTPVLLRDGTAMHQAALESERDMLRRYTADAIREGTAPRQAARELYARQRAAGDEGILRDYDRVMRTEIIDARNRGALQVSRTAQGWTGDTAVYRVLAVNPCSGCLRLWRSADGMPTVLPLRHVEAEDALGPNSGPWRTWHRRIGGTHPNCREGPLRRWSAALAATFAPDAARWAALRRERGLTDD